MQHGKSRKPLSLGRTVITPAAQELLHHGDVISAMQLHQSYDWGEVSENDWNANNDALKRGLRIISVYRDRYGTMFRIITEADRSYTTVMLPEDY